MAGVVCGKLDVNEIPSDEIVIIDGNIQFGPAIFPDPRTSLAYVKLTVGDKLYLRTHYNELTPRVHASIEFSSPCYASLCTDGLNTWRGANVLIRELAIDPAQQNAGTTNTTTPAVQALPSGAAGVQTLLDGANGVSNLTSLNLLGFQAQCVYPISAALPLKSKVFTYGPWASSNFSLTNKPDDGACGGTNVEKNPDLAPWIFGSTTAMNNVAQNLVEFANIGLTSSEQGTVTTPTLPTTYGRLGAVANAGGPSLTGINFSFGEGGISTTYDFRTYTPKFGRLNKLYVDKFKDANKKRNNQLRFLKNQSIQQGKTARKIRNNRIQNNLNSMLAHPPVTRQPSLIDMMTGTSQDFYAPKISGYGPSQLIKVGMETMAKSTTEMTYDYANKAFISLDGLFSPVSISGGDVDMDAGYILPRFIIASTVFDHKSSPIHAQPPFNTDYCENPETVQTHDLNNTRIHNLYLNPLANPNSIPYHSGDSQGHNIEQVGRESGIPASGLSATQQGRDGEEKYSEDYRFLGMRGPLVLHAWGYDVDGKPIPNIIDNEESAKSGIFVTQSGEGETLTGLKDQFLPDWLQKPATWPVGPVDLRFDRERGVWVSPQPFKIVVAQLKSDIEPWGEGIGILINIKDAKRYGRKLFDENGNPVKESNDCTAVCERGALRVITNLTFSDSCGLVAETAYVRVSSIRAGDNIVIPVTNCSSSSSSCSSSSSSSCSSSSSSVEPTNDYAMVKIVDRLGMDHYRDDMAYVYYDTYESAYVILQSNTLNW